MLEIGIGIYVFAIAVLLLFNRGAHKKPTPPIDPMFDFDILEKEKEWRR
jgi:hypothetical protein